MLQISNSEKLRIAENRGRKLEGDAVLSQTRGCFVFIPLKLKLPCIQDETLVLCYSSLGKRVRIDADIKAAHRALAPTPTTRGMATK